MKIIAMIPARLGSQRLKQKNLQEIEGAPIIAHAIRKCIKSDVFDEVWVNSESEEIGRIAQKEGVFFHRRSEELASNDATSEDFIHDFIQTHKCDHVVQVHSIAPLLKISDIKKFVSRVRGANPDVLLSYESIQIECSYLDNPVNFTYKEKTNSQDLHEIQRICWSITSWNCQKYLEAYESGQCATYAGAVEYYPLEKMASFVIKTAEDLEIARALFQLIDESE